MSPLKVLFLRTTWAKSESSAVLQRSHHLTDCQETGVFCGIRNLVGNCAGCVTITKKRQDILDEHDGDEIQDAEEQN